ncbi:hypothetical protein [Nocardia sp. NPDC059228]|uniref:hypothetical protein n=1 Tax=Nocardia sp. NPDC059228 TaxID=3346777 RepID=UPI003677E05C
MVAHVEGTIADAEIAITAAEFDVLADTDRVGYAAPQRAMVHPIWHDGGWTR